jgi:hypothetical protein
MEITANMPVRPILREPPEFSLVLGGPLYEMFRRAHLSGSSLEFLWRRMVVVSLFAWLPLAILSIFDGHMLGAQNLTFLRDIESHARFLVALPVLIFAELVVHDRIAPVVKYLVDRGVVTQEDTPKLYAAVNAALRARNSLWLELVTVLFVYTVGRWLWQHVGALQATTWYGVPDGTGMHLTPAGYWYSFVSIPIFQFILIRWYVRLGIWFQLLWRVSRLKLRLLPAHPDQAAGIGFLGKSSYGFSPIVFAQGVLLAGLIASRIFFQGQGLLSFKMTILAFVAFFAFVILGPLTMFTPQLSRAKRNGLSEYGTLSTAYVAEFHEKWVRGGNKAEQLLGTADIQSLADLGNSYAVVREMQLVPFGLSDITRLAGAAVLPVLPLLLTIMPLEELVTRLIKMIF